MWRGVGGGGERKEGEGAKMRGLRCTSNTMALVYVVAFNSVQNVCLTEQM